MSKTVLLGLFDGLHRGHRSAISEVLRRGGERTVFTFRSKSLDTKGERGLLMTDKEKEQQLRALGFEVKSIDFAQVRDMSPREFIKEILAGELHASAVVCGENFRFGKGGSGDIFELKRLCGERGISVTAVPLLYDGGGPVSTTRIRRLIECGDLAQANRLLGYPYTVGCMPFADGLTLDPDMVHPKEGSYRAVLIGSGEIDVSADIIKTSDNKTIAKIRSLSDIKIDFGENPEIRLINQIDIQSGGL